MRIQLACPSCQKLFFFECAAQGLRCPHCQSVVPAPTAPDATPVEDVAPGQPADPTRFAQGLKRVFLGALIIHIAVVLTGCFQALIVLKAHRHSLYRSWFELVLTQGGMPVLNYQRYLANFMIILGTVSVITGMNASRRHGDGRRGWLVLTAQLMLILSVSMALLAPLFTTIPEERNLVGHPFLCRMLFLSAYLLAWCSVGLWLAYVWPLLRCFGNHWIAAIVFLALTAAIFALHVIDYWLSAELSPIQGHVVNSKLLPRYYAATIIIFIVWSMLVGGLLLTVMFPLRRIRSGDDD